MFGDVQASNRLADPQLQGKNAHNVDFLDIYMSDTR
jgi:hypothetical protein